MVEFAMVVVFFLLLCYAVMQYGWLMFAQMNVQQAVDDGGRYASTGQEASSGNRITGIVSAIQKEISVPGVNVAQDISICSTPSGGTPQPCYNSGAGTGNIGAAGAPGATVTITLTTPLQLFTPLLSKFFSGGAYTFTASSTFRNEPFSPSSTN
jgi:Flp pilus assembly protein TadG